MKTVQVLVATMKQKDMSLCKKMNIQTDALIINQSNCSDYTVDFVNKKKLEMYTFNERGLSKSRNNALMRASGDIVCIADDDMTYVDGYEKIIIDEFEAHPDADAIFFYVETVNGSRRGDRIHEFSKLNKLKYMEYSSVDIAVKREKLIYNNIWFNVIFGSGSKYMCGEDTIFIKDMLRKGFKIYVSPLKIAEVDMGGESTWFDGYNEKHFYNKGALVAAIYPRLWPLAIIVLSLKNSVKKLGDINKAKELFLWYRAGALDYKRRVR